MPRIAGSFWQSCQHGPHHNEPKAAKWPQVSSSPAQPRRGDTHTSLPVPMVEGRPEKKIEAGKEPSHRHGQVQQRDGGMGAQLTPHDPHGDGGTQARCRLMIIHSRIHRLTPGVSTNTNTHGTSICLLQKGTPVK